ncbi:MAG: heavy metal translocating P-type ATPase [Phycisphaerae bacterium]|nr:heavy metal translocating P-type ATPase [Phycisphaerae bacterium]
MGDTNIRHFRIAGMDCAEEVAVLKRELGPLVGGEERLSFDVLRGRLTLSAEASDVGSRQVMDAVAKTGMRAEPWSEASSDAARTGLWQRWGRAALTGLSGMAIAVAVTLHAWLTGSVTAAFGAESTTVPWAVRIVYGLAVVSGAWVVAPKAWYAARRLRPDMNLLMMVAVLGAALIGEWFEAAAVAFLFSLSLLLESWSVGRARRAVAALMDLAPPTVRLRTGDGEESLVAPDEVSVGATFIVKPGERIPLDGEVLEGSSHVNQAPITGESKPVVKQAAASVFAGTINGDGALLIRSSKPVGETTLANIFRLVGEAHSRKAPSEQWVEKFARVYTPGVMATALAVLLVPPVLFGGSWEYWLYNALVLLVIACPCALVISTPVSIVASLTAAARQGVLVKGGVFIEAPARLQAIAFDKTGTLTQGKPSVVEVIPLNGHDEAELMERALALESRSEHPSAHAIVEYATQKGIKASPADDFQVIQGKGAEGHFNGRLFWLGSHRYLEERGQEIQQIHDRLEEMAGTGRSVVVVGNEEHVCGLIGLADTIRPTTRHTLERLREAGVQHLIMLTGDNAPTARVIAEQVGLTEFRAELLPEDKIAAVETLVSEYGNVAMVGDGVNDAPALARASVGIAMGAAGTDAAIETADIALMTDDLSRLPWLIQHSRRTLTIIRQNISFSLAIKALFVGLTFFGMASLWAAIAADMGASLLVIFNGLRLLHPGNVNAQS